MKQLLKQAKTNVRQLMLAVIFACFAGGQNGFAVSEKGGLVSIDFCADQYLLALADRHDIQAVSYEATGPRSYYGERAQGLDTVRGAVEELLLLRPGLVLSTWRGGVREQEIMNRASIPFFRPPFSSTIEASVKSFLTVGERIGKAERAQAFVETRLAQLNELQSLPRLSLKAVYLTPSGYTAGKNTFVDEIIGLAGFDTVAAEANIEYWVPLPLEKMVISPPELVIATFFGDEDVHVSHWSSGRHSVFGRLMAELPVIHVPSQLLSCSGLFAVEAANFIRKEARNMGLVAAQKEG